MRRQNRRLSPLFLDVRRVLNYLVSDRLCRARRCESARAEVALRDWWGRTRPERALGDGGGAGRTTESRAAVSGAVDGSTDERGTRCGSAMSFKKQRDVAGVAGDGRAVVSSLRVDVPAGTLCQSVVRTGGGSYSQTVSRTMSVVAERTWGCVTRSLIWAFISSVEANLPMATTSSLPVTS